MFALIAIACMFIVPLMMIPLFALPVYYVVLRIQQKRDFKRQLAEMKRERVEREASAERLRARIAAEEKYQKEREGESRYLDYLFE